MRDETFQIIGLAGFIISGVIYTIVGVLADDLLTIAGSLVWTIACFFWLVPLVRKK